ncbi:putative DNA-binding transcriptional regulator YafY [Saccharothrix tamanrassetensis]|uniref:Putative DNA-binding transcriptional regulator YafY n=1 Tax=Saccharothrix tamanrassetensis TaxID=1051531 RepID=A0A841CQJ4_9PSEU|nr:YafY family protein [Saccharothrix tamanrassetensis]MBB5959480.1 putative DNA-binding transcriptional regulator YafY [Saccharothrix tamanrassetensis]
MSDTPGRLLTLLSLLQTPREWPGSELARRLEVSPRTIRRDIDRLRDLGYPVHATMGAEGGYRLAAGTAMPPLLLDDEEAVAIAVGLRTAARQAVTGIEESSVRALAKLEQVLPTRLRRRVGALGAATVPVSLGGDGVTVDPEHLATMAAAVANRERLRFHYLTADGTQTRRHVEPRHLVPSGRRWYLLAFDLDRDDWRIFRVDRVDRLLATGARAEPRELPGPDAATYVRDKMLSLAPTYRAVATVHLPIARLRGRLGDTPTDLEPVDGTRTRVHSHTDTLEFLAFQLVQLGCEFEVHEPPELIAYLRELRGRIDRAVPAEDVRDQPAP